MKMLKVIGGIAAVSFFVSCNTTPTQNSVANLTNSNASNANVNAVQANSNTNTSSAVPEAAEPTQYQATVTMKLEAIGQTQNVAMPTITAQVARSGSDRRMVFTMPAGGRVVYLDRAGTNYLVLPDRKQYAELNRDSLGFEVRQLMMPEQIVDQVRKVEGVQRVGEEMYNGRQAIKYRYAAVAQTDSRAGQVSTESYLYVDKATGLPLHSETVSRSQSGANVQGYQGVRIVTDITDINADAPADLFDEPTEFQKIESSQVRAQVDMIFNAIASALTQAMQQMNTTASPPATPSR